jgi:putative PEP-CTERM system TPR-repeat lipoprotein
MPEKMPFAIRFVHVLALISVLFISGCNLFTNQEERFNKAVEYRDKGELNAAVIEFKNVLKGDPDHLQARWLLGKTYLQLNDAQRAKKELLRAKSLGKNDKEMTVELVQAYLQSKEPKEALRMLNALPADAWDAQAFSLRGDVQLGLGLQAEARESFLESLKLDSSYSNARYGLIRLALVKADFSEAEQLIDQVLAEKQDDFQGLVFKAELELSRGAPEEAIKAYKKALQGDSDNLFVKVGLARAYLALGRVDEAETQLDSIDKISPNGLVTLYLKAVAARQRNDLNAAKTLLLEVLSKAPEHYPSQLLLGSIQFESAEYEQAVKQLSSYLTHYPDYVPAKKLLAQSYIKLGSNDKAIDLLESAVASVPDDPQLLALLGNLYASKQAYAKSEDYYQRALALKPGTKEIETRLALNRWASGDQDQAIAELSTIVATGQDYVPADLALISAQLKSKAYKKALDAALSLAEKRPEYPVAYALAAAASEGMGERKQARAYLEKSIQVDPRYINGYLSLARQDMTDGKTDAAKKRLNDALEKNPHAEQILLMLAQLEERQGNKQAAMDLISRAKENNPQALAPRLLLASAALQVGKFDAARGLAEEAFKIAPGNLNVLRLRAEVERMSGNDQAALKIYEQILKVQPGLADVHLKMGELQSRMGKWDDARRSLQEALSLDPAHWETQRALGEVELRLGHQGKAAELAEQLIQGQHDDAAGYALKGDVLMSQGKPEAAVASYRQAHAIAGGRSTLLRLSNAMRASGKSSESAQLLSQWIQQHPEDLGVRMNYAGLLQSQGDLAGASAGYEQILAARPNDVVAMNNLAWIYQTQGKTVDALKLAEQAYKAQPEVAGIMDTYGWILVNGQQVDKGLKLLEQAVAKQNKDPDIRYHLAVAYARADKKDRARSELKEILATNAAFSERENARQLLESLR